MTHEEMKKLSIEELKALLNNRVASNKQPSDWVERASSKVVAYPEKFKKAFNMYYKEELIRIAMKYPQ